MKLDRRLRPASARLFATLLLLAVAAVAARAQDSYFLTELPSLGGGQTKARGISNSGKVVGESLTASGIWASFSWDGSTISNLGSLGGPSGSAYAVNELGYAVGGGESSVGGLRPFIWSDIFGIKDLGTTGGIYSLSWDVNDSSVVVGQFEVTFLVDRGFIWSAAGGVQPLSTLAGDLPGYTSVARGINNTGQVVGNSDTANNETHAFLYVNGNFTDLGTLGGKLSIANEINDSGYIVGYSTTVAGVISPPARAFLYRSGMGMLDLGTLGGNFSTAYDINNKTQVVGYSTNASGQRRAFIYDTVNGMRDLNNLVSPGSFVLEEAWGINERGQIVGYGRDGSGNYHGFILSLAIDEIPAPEPPPCYIEPGSPSPQMLFSAPAPAKITPAASGKKRR